MVKFNNILSNIFKIDVNLIKWNTDADEICGTINNIDGSIINFKYYNSTKTIRIENILKLTYDGFSIEIHYNKIQWQINLINNLLNISYCFNFNYYIYCNNKVYKLNYYIIFGPISRKPWLISKYYDFITYTIFKKIIQIKGVPYEKRYYYLYNNYYLYIYNHNFYNFNKRWIFNSKLIYIIIYNFKLIIIIIYLYII